MKLKPGAYKPVSAEDWLQLEHEVRTLFTPATPIDDKDLFAGRGIKIEDLIEAVIERGRHAVLYGERGVGKTSLANIFHRILPGPTRHVYAVRVQCDPKDSFKSMWKKAFDDLTVKNEDGSKRVYLSELISPEITPNDVRRLFELFTPNELPIVIFDEFDKIADPEVRGIMANTLKGLADHSSRATVVIVGVADDVDSLIGEHESIRRHLAQVHMPRMSDKEQLEIIDKRIRLLGMKISHSARWKIVLLSRGLPAYVHQLGRFAALAAARQKTLAVVDAHVTTAMNDVLTQRDQSCRHDYERATFSNRANLYQEILLACATVEDADDVGYFSPAQIVEPLGQILKKSVEIANFLDQLNKFTTAERGAILQRTGKPRAYRFRFRDPMMQPFVLIKGIQAGLINRDPDLHKTPDQPTLFPSDV